MSTSAVVEVTLEKLVYGGDAIGRLPDGRAVFVPFGIPGETVRLRVVEEKAHHARGEIVEVLTPSDQRIQSRCRHFGVCGGCHYQHMPYEAQLKAKSEILRDQLERIGRLKEIPLQPIVPSPQEWNYRNHVEFGLTSKGELGFARQGSHQMVPVQECHLPEAPINEVWLLLEIDPQAGISRVSLRMGSEEDIQVTLVSEVLDLPDFSVEGLPLSVVHVAQGSPSVLSGSPYIWLEVLGRPFRVSSGSFFQVNTPMAGEMVRHILANLPLDSASAVLDVYCGVGLFSAFLAPRTGRLIGIEKSPQACTDFEVNLDDFENVELYVAPAEDVLPYLSFHPDMVLVDPPRVGLDRRVLQALISLAPPRIVYVSCDPATLARDARSLSEGGYHLAQITPFDLFPQTYHIESISFWFK